MTLFEHLDTQLRALLESTGSEVAYLPGEMLFGPTGPEWSGIVRLGLIRVMSYLLTVARSRTAALALEMWSASHHWSGRASPSVLKQSGVRWFCASTLGWFAT